MLGLQILAGHVEMTLYVLLVSAFYAAWRLVAMGRRARHTSLRSGSAWHVSAKAMARAAGWLLAMIALGLAIGSVQLIPLYELVKQSFREGSATLAQIRGWAWPSRQILTFLLPDIFGNPTHHTYFDIWSRQWLPVTQNALGEPLNTIDWGVKNYVEGGNYLGIVTLLLAGVAVFCTIVRLWTRKGARQQGSKGVLPPAPLLPCTPAPLLPSSSSPRSPSSSPSARPCMPFCITACPAGISFTPRSAGCFPTR